MSALFDSNSIRAKTNQKRNFEKSQTTNKYFPKIHETENNIM